MYCEGDIEKTTRISGIQFQLHPRGRKIIEYRIPSPLDVPAKPSISQWVMGSAMYLVYTTYLGTYMLACL